MVGQILNITYYIIVFFQALQWNMLLEKTKTKKNIGLFCVFDYS